MTTKKTSRPRATNVPAYIDKLILSLIESGEIASYSQAINEALADYVGVDRPEVKRVGRPMGSGKGNKGNKGNKNRK